MSACSARMLLPLSRAVHRRSVARAAAAHRATSPASTASAPPADLEPQAQAGLRARRRAKSRPITPVSRDAGQVAEQRDARGPRRRGRSGADAGRAGAAPAPEGHAQDGGQAEQGEREAVALEAASGTQRSASVGSVSFRPLAAAAGHVDRDDGRELRCEQQQGAAAARIGAQRAPLESRTGSENRGLIACAECLLPSRVASRPGLLPRRDAAQPRGPKGCGEWARTAMETSNK